MVDSLFLWIYRVISMTCCNCVSRWYCCVWQDQQFSAIYSFNKAQNVNCMINCWKGKRKQKNIYIRQSVVFKSNFFFFFVGQTFVIVTWHTQHIPYYAMHTCALTINPELHKTYIRICLYTLYISVRLGW